MFDKLYNSFIHWEHGLLTIGETTTRIWPQTTEKRKTKYGNEDYIEDQSPLDTQLCITRFW